MPEPSSITTLLALAGAVVSAAVTITTLKIRANNKERLKALDKDSASPEAAAIVADAVKSVDIDTRKLKPAQVLVVAKREIEARDRRHARVMWTSIVAILTFGLLVAVLGLHARGAVSPIERGSEDGGVTQRTQDSTVPTTSATATAAPSCNSTLPAFPPGAAELRVAALRGDRKLAKDRASEFKDVLKKFGASDWMSHVSEPVATNLNGQDLQLVLIRGAKPDVSKQFCDWISCVGWDPGLLPCELRIVERVPIAPPVKASAEHKSEPPQKLNCELCEDSCTGGYCTTIPRDAKQGKLTPLRSVFSAPGGERLEAGQGERMGRLYLRPKSSGKLRFDAAFRVHGPPDQSQDVRDRHDIVAFSLTVGGVVQQLEAKTPPGAINAYAEPVHLHKEFAIKVPENGQVDVVLKCNRCDAKGGAGTCPLDAWVFSWVEE